MDIIVFDSNRIQILHKILPQKKLIVIDLGEFMINYLNINLDYLNHTGLLDIPNEEIEHQRHNPDYLDVVNIINELIIEPSNGTVVEIGLETVLEYDIDDNVNSKNKDKFKSHIPGDDKPYYSNSIYLDSSIDNKYNTIRERLKKLRETVQIIVDDYLVHEDYNYYFKLKPIATFNEYSYGNKEERYSVFNIEELIVIVLSKIIELKLNINKCGYCDDYFVPKSRKDEVYCDKVHIENNRTCKDMGFEHLLRKDKGKKEYRKAYKRKHSSWSKSEFAYHREKWEKWKIEAKINLEKYNRKELELEEFVEWLNE